MPSDATPANAVGQGADRRTAVQQLGGPYAAQPYYDTKREEIVVLRHKDGWGHRWDNRDYLRRTWTVEKPIDYVSDSGYEIETISQSTKIERMKHRYTNPTDDELEDAMDAAKDRLEAEYA